MNPSQIAGYMPNIALFSDLHADSAALARFQEASKARPIDYTWFLGDAVGRGNSNPIRVVRDLRSLIGSSPGNLALVGNHDLDALQELELGGLGGAAIMTSQDIALDRQHGLQLSTSPDLWNWVKGLPVQACPADFEGVYLAHGAFIIENMPVTYDHTHLTSQDLVMRQTFQPNAAHAQITEIESATQRPVHLLALGHTHMAACWYVTRTGSLPIACAIFDGPFDVPSPSRHR